MALIKKKKSKESDKPMKSSKTKTSKEKSSGTSIRDRAKDKLKESKKKGFSAMREAKSQQSNSGDRWYGFYVKKGESKTIIFLTDDPVLRRTHTVVERLPNGKEIYNDYLCTEDDDCKLCEEAQNGNKSVRNPSNSGMLLILDVDGYAKDDKEYPYQIKPWLITPTLSSVIEHQDVRYGIHYTAYDATKLDRGIALDIVRDSDDEVYSLSSDKGLLKMLKSESEDTYKLVKEKLEEYGDFRTWLEQEIIPSWLNPDNAKLNTSTSSKDDGDDDEYEQKSYGFNKKKDSKKSSSLGKRNRLR